MRLLRFCGVHASVQMVHELLLPHQPLGMAETSAAPQLQELAQQKEQGLEEIIQPLPVQPVPVKPVLPLQLRRRQEAQGPPAFIRR